jgi:hypothetical protein
MGKVTDILDDNTFRKPSFKFFPDLTLGFLFCKIYDMIVRPDKQIRKKEKVEKEKLSDIKPTDSIFKYLKYEQQKIVYQRERLYPEKASVPNKVNAQIIAQKKAEMRNIINSSTEVIEPKILKTEKKKLLDKKYKEIKGGKPQTKFVETISIKIPIQC